MAVMLGAVGVGGTGKFLLNEEDKGKVITEGETRLYDLPPGRQMSGFGNWEVENKNIIREDDEFLVDLSLNNAYYLGDEPSSELQSEEGEDYISEGEYEVELPWEKYNLQVTIDYVGRNEAEVELEYEEPSRIGR